MSIKISYIIYWVILHLIIASIMASLLKEEPLLLLAVEAFLVISLGLALYLAKQLQKPVEIMQEGLNLIKDQDLATHFVPDSQEELQLLIGTYNKMIDNLRRERQLLKEKEYFLDKIIAVAQTGLLLLDYDGKIAMLNPSILAILGGTSKEWIGQPLEALPYPFGQLLQEQEVGTAQLVTLSSRKRIKCGKSEFFDQGFPRTFITMDELTEELRLSEKAAYDKLIRVISHEINNSLGAVSSLLHTCLHYGEQLNAEDREDYEMAVRVMISRSDHLGAFMRSYADITRLQKPKKQLHSIEKILRDSALLFKAELVARNIKLRWDIDVMAEPLVGIERPQIEQVIVNIIKNAIEAADKDGYIRIIMQPKGKQTLICVEDSGPGIPAEVKANLFTPFFSTKPNGQGIGLTMLQEILINHQFEFSLESEEGMPTRFKIWMD